MGLFSNSARSSVLDFLHLPALLASKMDLGLKDVHVLVTGKYEVIFDASTR